MKNFIFFIAFIFALGDAFGQSVLIQPNANNGILSTNSSAVTTNPGTISLPILGVGTRLMWIPAKSAFRVGTVNAAPPFNTVWDDLNVGTWSFASGLNTAAYGETSTSFGSGTQATGNISTSMGYSTKAIGEVSTAMGNATTASGINATAIGDNSLASGYASTAMGSYSTASGNYSTAIGIGTTAQAYGSFSVGLFNKPISTTIASATTIIQTDPLFIVGNGTTSSPSDLSNAMVVLKNGKVGIGTNTIATNEILEVGGRMRLRRGTFASGFWLNNSANSSAFADGAFIGLSNDTPGFETIGFLLNGSFRFTVNRAGDTFQNTVTASSLAGAGVRSVSADANGMLTTASPTPTSHTVFLSYASFVFSPGSSTTYANYSSNHLAPNNDGFNNSAFSQLLLPDGAVVTNITFYYSDNSATEDFILRFSEDDLTANVVSTNLTILTSVSNHGNNKSVSAAVNVTINSNKVYTLNVTGGTKINATTMSSGNWQSTKDLKGVKINYTL